MTISLLQQQAPLDRGQRRSLRRPLPHQVAWVAIAAVTTVSFSGGPPCAAAAFSSQSSAAFVSRRHQSAARTRRIPNVSSSSSVPTTSQLSVGWMYEDDGMLSSSSSATQPLHARLNRDQRSRVAAASVSMTDDTTFLPTSSDRTSMASPTTTVPEWLTQSCWPVVSAALLITGNTVGAGCLVLPEVAAGPGLAAVTVMLAVAWVLNFVSGVVLAEVAIVQKERTVQDSDSSQDAALPTSFQDFAVANLGSPLAATAVSALSLFVNACVVAFDLSRVGVVVVGTGLLSGGLASAFAAPMVSIVWAAALAAMLTTLSTSSISTVCNVCVAALFVSFGSLLLPGLAHVPHDWLTVWSTPGTASAAAATSALDGSGLSQAFPVILMSLVFQNIVPVVVKMLDYDRSKTVAALGLGSLIPMVMYTAWCYACLGGGIDLGSAAGGGAGGLWTVFSLATLGASSLCTGLSMAEEVGTFFSSPPSKATESTFQDPFKPKKTQPDIQTATSNESGGFSVPAALVSVSVPLAAALMFGNGENGLTGALSLAGSFGSPILYGVIPALMAYRQRQVAPSFLPTSPFSFDSHLPPASEHRHPHMVSSSTLPVLGLLSTAFVGQEVVSRVGELAALAL